ncbi:MAG TPA: hypothetical protein VMH05_04950 [Bryobacteraceae bacterium]|nr:hypothetical protein [Bryobacteraceae bacterium]
MRVRDFLMVGCPLCLMISATALTVPAFAQGQYKAPRTADGHPDFQGFWENNIATPLERPKEIANRPTLTDAEVAKMRQKANEMFTGKSDAVFFDGFYPAVLDNVLGLKQGFKSADGGTGDYGSEWNDTRVWENRTSLITDPPDGRIPALTPRAVKARAAAREEFQRTSSVKDRPLGERCITYGSPQLTAGYQSYYQIVETPGAVMILTEMFHDVRVVRMNSRTHPPDSVQGWLGDSIGHWEGDTLVVDTTNYRPRAFQSISSAKLHIIERFTRQDAEVLRYQITVDDPDTYARPWTLMVPLQRSSKPVYEYACHEGNYAEAAILAGARAEESKKAASKETGK